MTLESSHSATAFKVNFLIMGTMKGGTSALHYFLAQHPEICMSDCKEPHFFDSNQFDRSADSARLNELYQPFFMTFHGQSLVGEATPIYMYVPFIAERIYRYNPHAKLIFLLRNPVDRALSHYQMQKGRNREWMPFSLALRAERFRLLCRRENYISRSRRWHSYIDRGFYSRQIKELLKFFPHSQMLFLYSDNLLNKHVETLTKVYDFLGVKDKAFIPEHHKVFSSPRRLTVTPRVISHLRKTYAREIVALEQLLGWNLDDWKKQAE